jgi:hypothetical protein
MQNFTLSKFFSKQSGFESALRELPMLKTELVSFLSIVGFLASSLFANAQNDDGSHSPTPEASGSIQSLFNSGMQNIWYGGTPTASHLDGEVVFNQNTCRDNDGEGIQNMVAIDNEGFIDRNEVLSYSHSERLVIGSENSKTRTDDHHLAARVRNTALGLTTLKDAQTSTFGMDFNFKLKNKSIVSDKKPHRPIQGHGFLLANSNGLTGEGVKIVFAISFNNKDVPISNLC